MYNAMCTTPHELISGKGSNYYTVTLTPKKSTQTHPQLMVSSLPKQKSAGYMRSVWYLPSPPPSTTHMVSPSITGMVSPNPTPFPLPPKRRTRQFFLYHALSVC